MLSHDRYLELYRALLTPRLVEERMLLLLRQGKLAKWFSGIGQEAVSVGVTSAIQPSDWLLPLIRNLGAFTARGVPLPKLFRQLFGRSGGYTKGRDRTFHFHALEHRIIANPTLLVANLPVAVGLALAAKMRGEETVAVAFCGDGGTSEGDFHEALNVASVWQVPVLFLVENNQYALSTPSREQYRCSRLADRAVGYGIAGHSIDGNDLLRVHESVSEIVSQMRINSQPVLLECNTFRMRGHEESSGTKYVPAEMFAEWSEKDPVRRFENHLAEIGVLGEQVADSIRQELLSRIAVAIDDALAAPPVASSVEVELSEVFAPSPQFAGRANSETIRELRFVDAIADGLQVALDKDQQVLVLGQDVAEYGGVFKVTEGLLERFGRERIRNTPLCESAVVGASLGLSLAGFRPIVELQFADFVSCGINQIYNNLSKQFYRTGVPASVVLRLPSGAGIGGGPYHSDANEAWFMHVPGLKIAFPSTPEDAKGMLLAAIEDPNPVLFFEHKWLYRTVSGPVPEGYYTVPLGVAKQVQSGTDVTIITYGPGVHWALELSRKRPEVSICILDLRSLAPLDWAAIERAVRSTGRVLILHEARLTGGVGAEIAALVAQSCFTDLDAPIERCADLDTPAPFAECLEQMYLASSRLEESLNRLLSY